MTRDPDELLGREALGDRLDRLVAAVRPSATVGGWATVELDRAEVEVGAALAGRAGAPRAEQRPDDALLGARCRMLRFPGDRDVLLLEPSTEGRVAASLVRFDEGTVVLYLIVDSDAPARARAAGFDLSHEADGPLGRERLVAGGAAWGPHLVLAGLAAAAPPPATIDG